MPSILTKYDRVEFLAGRPFTYSGVEYQKGDPVDNAKSFNNLESMVRSRYLVPVVDDYSKDAPLQFRREVLTRDLALRKLGISGEGVTEGRQGSGEGGAQQGFATSVSGNDAPETSDEFDPGKHSVSGVLDYVDEYPDELLSVYALEEQGKARPTLLKQLDDRLNKQVEEDNENV